MDEGADKGNKKQHQGAERVGKKTHCDVKITYTEPGKGIVNKESGFRRHTF